MLQCRTTLAARHVVQRSARQFSCEMMKNHDLIISIEIPRIVISTSNFVPVHATASSDRVVALNRNFEMAVAAILDFIKSHMKVKLFPSWTSVLVSTSSFVSIRAITTELWPLNQI